MDYEDVKLARKGDVKAFERIIDINKVYLYNIAKAITQNEADAGDAISETIYNAYKYLHKLKDDSLFKSWISRILINECKKIIRKRKDDVSMEEYEETLETEKNSFEEKEQRIELISAVNSLKNELKSVIILFYYNDLKINEIAEILEIPEGTVKSRLNTAKIILKQKLSERSI